MPSSSKWRLGTFFAAGKLLQPYCNRAGTGTYAVDKLSPRLSQNTCKIAELADGLVQARTHHSRLLISRFQVRVLGGSLLHSAYLSGMLLDRGAVREG